MHESTSCVISSIVSHEFNNLVLPKNAKMWSAIYYLYNRFILQANDKNAADNHTDESSQDSVDVKGAPVEKPVENNVNSENVDKPKEESTEGESDQEAENPEKKETSEADGNKKAEKPEVSFCLGCLNIH